MKCLPWVQVGASNKTAKLEFDPSAAMHNYTIAWVPGSTTVLIDGEMVLTVTDGSPEVPRFV